MPKLHRILAAAAALAALTTVASAKVEREVVRTFQVAPGAHIRVSTAGGDIRVSTSKDPVVKIVAKEHIRAGSEAEADELAERYNAVRFDDPAFARARIDLAARPGRL